MVIHDWDEKYKEGLEGEKEIDDFFSKYFTIYEVERWQQRLGVDRTFELENWRFDVEYKSDKRASDTGNAFIETTSVITQSKEGWAEKTLSDIIVYYLPKDKIAYLIRTDLLKEKMKVWKAKYPLVKAQNFGYYSVGTLVPLKEIKKISKQVPFV